jgi:hypothetical protein
MTNQERLELGEQLAAKVRGYFTDRWGEVAIPAMMSGDRDLYNLASRITDEVITPGQEEQRHG